MSAGGLLGRVLDGLPDALLGGLQGAVQGKVAAGAVGLLLFVPIVYVESVSPPEPHPDWVVMASAATGGQYHRTAIGVCSAYNRRAIQSGNMPLCAVQETEGSVDNLAYLREGRVDLALIQSDVICRAGPPPEDADRPPESIVALGPYEPLHVMVRDDADITTFDQLSEAKMHLGMPKSGTLAVAEAIAKAGGFDAGTIIERNNDGFTPETAVIAMCEGNLDAVFRVIEGGELGQNSSLARVKGPSCNIRLLPLPRTLIDDLTGPDSLYAKVDVTPRDLFVGNLAATIAPRAALVARSGLDPLVRDDIGRATLDLASGWAAEEGLHCPNGLKPR